MSNEAGTLGCGGDNKKSQERCEKNESPWILMTAFMEREQAHVRNSERCDVCSEEKLLKSKLDGVVMAPINKTFALWGIPK
jgi:hypothetical protein